MAETDPTSAAQTLTAVRARLDEIDAHLLALVDERTGLHDEITALRVEAHTPARQHVALQLPQGIGLRTRRALCQQLRLRTQPHTLPSTEAGIELVARRRRNG